MEEIWIDLQYKTIVRIERLCDYLWIDQYCVSEWIVSWYDTKPIKITKDTKWILDELADLIED